jgi:hypothetical protein
MWTLRKPARTRALAANSAVYFRDRCHSGEGARLQATLKDGAQLTLGENATLVPVRKVKVEKLRDELKTRGFLEAKESGGLTDLSRQHFQRAKAALLAPPKPRLTENDGLIWR